MVIQVKTLIEHGKHGEGLLHTNTNVWSNNWDTISRQNETVKRVSKIDL